MSLFSFAADSSGAADNSADDNEDNSGSSILDTLGNWENTVKGELNKIMPTVKTDVGLQPNVFVLVIVVILGLFIVFRKN